MSDKKRIDFLYQTLGSLVKMMLDLETADSEIDGHQHHVFDDGETKTLKLMARELLNISGSPEYRVTPSLEGELLIWAYDCIDSISIVQDLNYPFKPDSKQLAHGLVNLSEQLTEAREELELEKTREGVRNPLTNSLWIKVQDRNQTIRDQDRQIEQLKALLADKEK